MAAQNEHSAVVNALILAGANVDLANEVRTMYSMNRNHYLHVRICQITNKCYSYYTACRRSITMWGVLVTYCTA